MSRALNALLRPFDSVRFNQPLSTTSSERLTNSAAHDDAARPPNDDTDDQLFGRIFHLQYRFWVGANNHGLVRVLYEYGAVRIAIPTRRSPASSEDRSHEDEEYPRVCKVRLRSQKRSLSWKGESEPQTRFTGRHRSEDDRDSSLGPSVVSAVKRGLGRLKGRSGGWAAG